MSITRAILLPGNGCDCSEEEMQNECMWYGWIMTALKKAIPSITETKVTPFPDPIYARKKNWFAFIRNELKIDEKTLLVCHSSGSACALRLLEEDKVGGVLLVAAYDSDLGDETERKSGYFDGKFNYELIKSNAKFIVQFHSKNDHLVPVECGRRVAQGLSLGEDYIETGKDGHFQHDEYPEFVEVLKEKILKLK